MKQNETKNQALVTSNPSTSDSQANKKTEKNGKEKKIVVAKQQSLTAEEREELYKQKINEERRAELLGKMSDEEKEKFLKKERQDKFFKKHKSCYLQLFSGYCTKGCNKKSQIVLNTETFIKERGYILGLFTNKKYISNLEFENKDKKYTILYYDFDANKLIYENDCESVERMLKQFSLAIEPMGDIVGNRKVKSDEINNPNVYGFNYEYEKEFDEDKEEIISREDSSNYELNQNITKDLIKKSKNNGANLTVVEIGAKLTGKSKAEIKDALLNQAG